MISFGRIYFVGSDFDKGTIVSVESGGYHNISLRDDGSIFSWGLNNFLQCSSTPTDSDFNQVDAGYFHSIALHDDGSISAWGSNYSDEYLTTEYGQGESPDGNDYVKIATGYFHNLAIKANGDVIGWGKDSSGECVTQDDANYIDIAAGWCHSVGLRADGTINCWGNSTYCGVVPEGNDFVQVSASEEFSLALRENGDVEMWGADSFSVPTGTDYIQVEAGISFLIGLCADGSIDCIGPAMYNQGIHPVGSDFNTISVGPFHSLALRDSGSVEGWGNDNRYIESYWPDGNDYVDVACGYDLSLALCLDGSVFAWGDTSYGNDYGQTEVPEDINCIAIAAGRYHGSAIQSDHTLVSWGRSSQTTVPDGNDFVEVACGDSHSIARRSNGEVEAWGSSGYSTDINNFISIDAAGSHSFGICSDGNAVSWGSVIPVPYTFSGGDYTQASAMVYNNLVLCADSNLYGWDGYGDPIVGIPVEASDLKQLGGGDYHFVGLKNSGELYGAVFGGGADHYGETLVPSGFDFVKVDGGMRQSIALATGKLVGDLNRDSWVDFKDMAIFGVNYMETGDNIADVYPEGGDGLVDSDDLQVILDQWLLYSHDAGL